MRPHPSESDHDPQSDPSTRPDQFDQFDQPYQPSRLDRLTDGIQRFNQAVMLLTGAVLLGVMLVAYVTAIRAGERYDPPWMTYAIPLAVLAWLLIAAFNVRQLWRAWREWRTSRQRQDTTRPSEAEPAPPTSLP